MSESDVSPVKQAMSDFISTKERLCRCLAAVPDERLNWSPSPTARTPVQVVAHAAIAVKYLHSIFDGQPFEAMDTAAADKVFREEERHFDSREAVLSLLDQNSARYLTWLDTLTPERLDSMVEMPFGFGLMRVKDVLAFQSLHMSGHIPQLEYIQTIYGDRVWHA